MSDWADEAIDSIQVPSTAGPTDPAVIIGEQAQPILSQLPTPQLAGVLWQLGNGQYFVQSVDVDNPGDSRMHLYLWDNVAQTDRSDVLEATIAPDHSGFIELMDGQLKLSWDSTRLIYKITAFAPTEFFNPVTFDDDIKYGGHSLGRGNAASYFTRAGAVATTPTSGAETAMASWDASSSGPMTWVQGRAYRLRCHIRCYDATATETAEAWVRVRRAINSTSAAELAFFSVPIPPVGANVPTYYYESYVFKNTATSTDAAQIGYTIARQVGGATSQLVLYGDGSHWNASLKLIVEDIGAVADQPAGMDAITI